MCYFSCCITFWITQYNTPRTFHLPTTQSFFTINVTPFGLFRQPFKLHISPCLRRLGQIRYPFSYHLPCWFVVRTAPPVSLRQLALPFGAWANVLSTTHASMLPHPVFSDKDCFRSWAGLLNVPFYWRRFIEKPSYLLLTKLPLRSRLGEPYLPQGLSTLNSYIFVCNGVEPSITTTR